MLSENWTVRLLDSDCDRCGRHADKLAPFKLTEAITYYGRVIEAPWLCLKCFKVEKVKWWEDHGGGLA